MGFQIKPLDDWKLGWMSHDLSELNNQDFTNVYILVPEGTNNFDGYNTHVVVIKGDCTIREYLCGAEITHCFLHRKVFDKLSTQGVYYLLSRLRSTRYMGNMFIKVFEDGEWK